MEQITKAWTIKETLEKYPQTMEVFIRHGLHCVSCVIAQQETIEQGAQAHGIEADSFVKELNKSVKKKGG
jgi:hybrid cluster-associated redox disulfide protein